ncbi:glycosyltransferase [Ectothiorhodospira variabilis]|uniref:glycosyltransferase n=1 Tax=Ectothiorhodospira variabilis TaxID=505694 RepID=UPI001EFB8DF7|nr:glycosyltransferase [Ectothiorhodospira variabilis]MCG5493455.1 glycosyltransferase [Ectothiorhodospira variabilis]MCG5496801.1 glycosyltransferase [Ectothiorhodospira variabilis]MCG5502784.1 glycosyltransferase [Ectothiorhodospira variabilis]MCG5506428.1 glycosyltransferase [Ectothiorhodospira variabilis]
MSLTVLHVEAGRHLYGGALQVRYLIEGLSKRGVINILVCPHGAALGRAVEPSGAQVHELPMSGELDLGAVGRLRRLIRQVQPDLVHLHSRRGADVFGGVAARLCRVPAVVSRRVDNPERAWVARLKYRLFHRVITISQAIREVLVREGVPADKVVCVPSAVDVAAYGGACDGSVLREVLGFSGDETVVGVIAQLIPRKGHRYLLEAAPRILQAHPGVRFVFFGQGPQEGEIRELVSRLGLDAHVLLAGFRDDLPRILPCLDLVVHPVEMEGLGVSLLQAGAAGVPMVGARAGGVPEILGDDAGLLVPPGDVPALTEAVLCLLDDPDLRRHLGRAARERVSRRFSLDAMVEGNLAIYREVIGQDARPDGP